MPPSHARVQDGELVEVGLPSSAHRPAFDGEGRPIMAPLEDAEGNLVYPEREITDDAGKVVAVVPDVEAGPLLSDVQATVTVSNYDRLPEEELAADGWLPMIDPGRPAVDETAEQIIERYEVQDGAPVVVYDVEEIPQPEPLTTRQRALDLAANASQSPDDLHELLGLLVDRAFPGPPS